MCADPMLLTPQEKLVHTLSLKHHWSSAAVDDMIRAVCAFQGLALRSAGFGHAEAPEHVTARKLTARGIARRAEQEFRLLVSAATDS